MEPVQAPSTVTASQEQSSWWWNAPYIDEKRKNREPKEFFEHYLRFLGHTDEQDVIELQMLKVKSPSSERTFTKYAHSRTIAGATALAFTGEQKYSSQGVFVVPNKLNEAVSLRAKNNQWQNVDLGGGTKDEDITARRVVYVDLDPHRTSGVSANKEEVSCAREKAKEVLTFLAERIGTDNSLGLGFSGNGFQIHIAVDLPATLEVTAWVKTFLVALSARFSTAEVKVDTSVSDAKRLAPAFGTLKRKGVNSKERPHRRSWFACHDEVKRLQLPEFEKLVRDVEAIVPQEKPPPLPPATMAAAGSGASSERAVGPINRTRKTPQSKGGDDQGGDLLALLNQVAIREVAEKLGLDTEHPRCPWCDHGGEGSDVAFIDQLTSNPRNLLNCKHASCKRPNKTPVDLVAKVAFKVDEIKGSKGVVSRVCGWFKEYFPEVVTSMPSVTVENDREPADGGLANSSLQINVNQPLYVVVSNAEKALATHNSVYTHNGRLVEVIENGHRHHPENIDKDHLRVLLSSVATWCKTTPYGPTPAHVPNNVVAGLFTAKKWPSIRSLRGITSSPILRPDGTILCEPGWDPDTRLLYIPNCEYPPVPEYPTSDEVKRALDDVLEPFVDFPFGAKLDQGVLLSMLFSVLSLHAHDGPIPIHAVDGNIRGVGKDLLCSIVGIIATGQAPGSLSHTPIEEEQTKKILAIAQRRAPMTVISNLRGTLEGQVWEQVSTTRVFSGRILGQSVMWEGPLDTVWVVNGNNVEVGGDMCRRILRLRLTTPQEAPERRTNLKHPNIIQWVCENRGRLLIAALTLLRHAYVEKCPKDGLTLGSFEQWSRIVPPLVRQLGYGDVTLTTKTWESHENADSLILGDLLRAWYNKYESTPQTLSAILEALANDEKISIEDPTQVDPFMLALRNAVNAYAGGRRNALPSARSFAAKLHHHHERAVGGLRLVRGNRTTTNTSLWFVEKVDSLGTGSDATSTERSSSPQGAEVSSGSVVQPYPSCLSVVNVDEMAAIDALLADMPSAYKNTKVTESGDESDEDFGEQYLSAGGSDVDDDEDEEDDESLSEVKRYRWAHEHDVDHEDMCMASV